MQSFQTTLDYYPRMSRFVWKIKRCENSKNVFVYSYFQITSGSHNKTGPIWQVHVWLLECNLFYSTNRIWITDGERTQCIVCKCRCKWVYVVSCSFSTRFFPPNSYQLHAKKKVQLGYNSNKITYQTPNCWTKHVHTHACTRIWWHQRLL